MPGLVWAATAAVAALCLPPNFLAAVHDDSTSLLQRRRKEEEGGGGRKKASKDLGRPRAAVEASYRTLGRCDGEGCTGHGHDRAAVTNGAAVAAAVVQ